MPLFAKSLNFRITCRFEGLGVRRVGAALTFLQANANSRAQRFDQISAEIDKLPAAKLASRKKVETEIDVGAHF